MSQVIDQEKRIQRSRTAAARFGPIVEAGISPEWAEMVVAECDWSSFLERLAIMSSDSSVVGLGDASRLLECVTALLDLFDEEPTGSMYYPFKAAELIEQYCRMATGDLPDDAPVSLAEWVERFAAHVDWQLAQSGISIGNGNFFLLLERELCSNERRLSGNSDATFLAAMEASREAANRYLEALRAALAA